MADLTIRSIEPDELPAFMKSLELAFHGREGEDDLEFERLIFEPDRYLVAMEGNRIVGTAAACTTRFTVPGATVTAPGVTAVGVLPSHRRRGINTRLMAAILDQAEERGEPLAYLWASESSIYGRFGYGIASLCAELEMTTHRSVFAPWVRPTGTVRSLPREEALPPMRRAYETAASRRPGMVLIDDRWWEWLTRERKKDAEKPVFFAVHEDEQGVPDGFATYKVKHEWPHGVASNELEIELMVCATGDAEIALWRFLFDVDLVATVKAWDRPPDDAVLRVVQEPRRLRFSLSDGLWLRLLDVPGALAARRYRSDGTLVVEVDDPFRPGSAGRYELTVTDGVATSTRTDASADLACDVRALGAAYLGGSSFHDLHRSQQVGELTGGALERADAMFAWDPAPWFGFIF